MAGRVVKDLIVWEGHKIRKNGPPFMELRPNKMEYFFQIFVSSQCFCTLKYVLCFFISFFSFDIKVNTNQNHFMKTSFLPKYQRFFSGISALASKINSNKKIRALYKNWWILFWLYYTAFFYLTSFKTNLGITYQSYTKLIPFKIC